jgi:hypothetical protein
MKNEEFLTPQSCNDLKSFGWPQGRSEYLWHKNKHNHDKWELYKRNPHDISMFADSFGYSRWVTAIRRDNPFLDQFIEENEVDVQID